MWWHQGLLRVGQRFERVTVNNANLTFIDPNDADAPPFP
jgi:hypothetical protein